MLILDTTPGRLCARLLPLAMAILLAVSVRAADEARKPFDIPADAAEKSLKTYAAQSGREVLFVTEATKDVRTPAVKGELTSREALDRLLAGTPLTATENSKSGAIKILRDTSNPPPEKNAPSRPASDRAARDTDAGVLKLETFEVMGSKSLNMDIRRSQDDPQPYVVFDRAKIEESGATDVNDFLKQRLTMNTTTRTGTQDASTGGAVSTINLRGLGASQTLILIDGRRAARSTSGFSLGQPDLNGIPLAAIQRIEVLPTTASAIYGGAATGGVVNVILRRDYAGAEVKLTYDNTFDTDSAKRRVDFSSGFNFRGGKTNVMLTASYSDGNFLLVRDRNFLQRGRAAILVNSPATLQSGTLNVAGATPNIRSTSGANLVLKNGTPLNSNFTFSPAGYAGAATDGGIALVANAGKYNFEPAGNALTSGGDRSGLNNVPEVVSSSISVRHEFSSRLQGFAEASHFQNTTRRWTSDFRPQAISASSPTNPFLQDITVYAPTPALDGLEKNQSRYIRLAGGLILKISADWLASVDYTWTKARTSSDGAPTTQGSKAASLTAALNSGAIDLLRDPRTAPLDLSAYISGAAVTQTPMESILQDAAFRLSGPLGIWGERSPHLSMLLERQVIAFGEGAQLQSAGASVTLFPERTQDINSAYLELLFPLVPASHKKSWLQKLDLQLAGRWDGYKGVNGDSRSYNPPALPLPFVQVKNKVDSINPLVALSYVPLDGIALRASYGTGFLPPELNQVSLPGASITDTTTFSDPRRGGTGPVGSYQLTSGGNPNLTPESSTSWSAGVILSPKALGGLRVSVDYTHIDKSDNIQTLSRQQVLDNESLFPSRVTRGATLASDPSGWAGPVTALDITVANVAKASLDAYDLQLDYTLKTTSVGTFSFYALGTWQTHLKTQIAASVPFVETVGVASGGSVPVKFKSNAGITWSTARWSLGATVRYFDSYYVANPTLASSAATLLRQGDNGRVPSQTYYDAFAKYRFSHAARVRGGRLIDGLEIQMGIRNLFNTEPPFDVNNAQNFYSYIGEARLSSYYLSLTQRF